MDIKLLTELAAAWDAEIDAHEDKPNCPILVRAQFRYPPVIGTLVAIGIAHHAHFTPKTPIPSELLEFIRRCDLRFSVVRPGKSVPVRVQGKKAIATPIRTDNYCVPSIIITDNDDLRERMRQLLAEGARDKFFKN